MKIVWFALSSLFCISLFSNPIRLSDVEIDYHPVVNYSYIELSGSDLAKVQPEIRIEYLPSSEYSKSNGLNGQAKITLMLHIYMDATELASTTQMSTAKEIIHYQIEDAEILMTHKFGGYLSRLAGQEFDSVDNFMTAVLDQWNNHWGPSVEMWDPYYAGLKTGVYPKQTSNFIPKYRRFYYGNANA